LSEEVQKGFLSLLARYALKASLSRYVLSRNSQTVVCR